MFKILIVDDEKIVLDAVRFILEKNFFEIVTHEIARSGREAIEKADEFNPDIVMMDIRMPGINGIDAIKEIKNRHPKTKFIIVSAYEQFDFAKEAVELKVYDYILKPIIKNKLVSVLEKVMDLIRAENEIKKKELEIVEKYERVIPLLEYGFLSSIVVGQYYNYELNQYKEVLDLNDFGGYIMIIELGNNYEFDLEEDSIPINYFAIVSDALKCKCRCLVGPAIFNRIIGFIHTTNKGRQELKNEGLEIAKYVHRKLLNANEKQRVKISIGNYKELANISKSFDEALMAIKYVGNAEVITHVDDLKSDTVNIGEYPYELEGKLLDQIKSGDLEGALNSFDSVFKWIFSSYKNVFEMGRAKLVELFVLVHVTAFQNGLREKENENYLLEIFNHEDYLKLEKWCKDRLVEVITTINTVHNKKNNRIIVQAKEYIYENYSRDITLEEVAKVVSVTPHYFSRLFKEETGENFIEYLTIFRIKKAKKIMDTTNLNIKEICYKIGYSDPNYFSRLFKKVEKVTPTDYMKNSNRG